jgi:hypothetical protein
MKTMLLAAAAALSLVVGSAYANESGSQSGGYVYPDYQFPSQNVPSGAAAQNGQATHTYVTQSSHGTWLFQANQNQGSNS